MGSTAAVDTSAAATLAPSVLAVASSTLDASMVRGRPPVAERSAPPAAQSSSATRGAPTPAAADRATKTAAGTRQRPRA